MSTWTFFLVCAIAALVISTVSRAAGWGDDFSFVFSMAAMVALMLVCFPLIDPDRGFGRRSKR